MSSESDRDRRCECVALRLARRQAAGSGRCRFLVAGRKLDASTWLPVLRAHRRRCRRRQPDVYQHRLQLAFGEAVGSSRITLAYLWR